MDENNQKPASFPTGKEPPERPMPPPPPPPEITLRTMKSDIGGLKETGGAAPAPKPFTPPLPPPPLPKPPVGGPLPKPPEAAGIPAVGLGTKITPSEFGAPSMPKPPPVAPPVIEEEPKEKGKSKKIIFWIVGGVIIAAIGLAGYFVIFPMLFPPEIPSPPAPAVTVPAELPTVPEAEAVPAAEAPAAVLAHQSLLRSSDAISNVTLASADLLSLTNALQQEAQKALAAGTLAEITLSDASGQIPASVVLPALLPELSAETAKKLFEEDFTAALYYDADGAWPAYILKLSLEASIVEAQAAVTELESSLNLSNLFLASPGTPNAAGFKDGLANGVQTRYLAYSKKGAALNFAWSDDKLVISASYNGLKKILNNL